MFGKIMVSFYTFVSRNLLMLLNLLVITNSIYDTHKPYIVNIPNYAYNQLTTINISCNTLQMIDLSLTALRCAILIGIASDYYNNSLKIKLEKEKKTNNENEIKNETKK